MEFLKTKTTTLFLYGMDWYVYSKSALGLDKVSHAYDIISSGKKKLVQFIKYSYQEKEYILIDRTNHENIKDLFPIYPPLKDDLDSNMPVIVTDDNGDDITDRVLMFAGPKGDFYRSTNYYVRLRNISSIPITIIDTNMDEYEFKMPSDIIRLN